MDIEERKQIVKRTLETPIANYKVQKISTYKLTLSLEKGLSKIFKLSIPVKIIENTSPFIFVKCETLNNEGNIVLDKPIAIYISKQLLFEFSSGEITAALLSEASLFTITTKNPTYLTKLFNTVGQNLRIKPLVPLLVAAGTYAIHSYKELKKSLHITKKIQYEQFNQLIPILAFVYMSFRFTKLLYDMYITSFNHVAILKVSSDKFIAKYGYGPELLSFINKYKEEVTIFEDEINSLKVITSTINYLLKRIIKTHTFDKIRACNLAKELLSSKYKTILAEKDKQKLEEYSRIICKKVKRNVNSDIDIMDQLAHSVRLQLQRRT